MARPRKKALDYFPLDVDFLHDIKVAKLRRKCGSAAVTVFIAILCRVYRYSGYFLRWSDDAAFIIREDVGESEEFVCSVVTECVTLGLFDNTLFQQHAVLTSRSIQLRYYVIRRRLNILNDGAILPQFALIDCSDVPPDVTAVKPPVFADAFLDATGRNLPWLQQQALRRGYSLDAVRRSFDDFRTYCASVGHLHRSILDARRHFIAWLNKIKSPHE